MQERPPGRKSSVIDCVYLELPTQPTACKASTSATSRMDAGSYIPSPALEMDLPASFFFVIFLSLLSI